MGTPNGKRVLTAKEMKALLRSLHITQAQVAKRANVSVTLVNKMLAEDHRPSDENYNSILKAMRELIAEKEEQGDPRYGPITFEL